ncbi:MAG: RluA family pseudouridine synthase [Bacteroidales bacterium]|jgi:23S rRNA pseudouridine1911/1915/1917 synthase|nr:RluA family pseudouridine synthase [Bacteroidales bacterium]HOI32468.1 RluA family pseudouridine synthase [Bacteroidales bacterium]
MPHPFESRVLFEDNHLLVINKRPSELVQGDKTGDTSLLDEAASYLKWKGNKTGAAFVGLVHRIDRPVSGVLLLAKTSKALSRLTIQLKDKNWNKTYLVIVQHFPPKTADKLTHWLKKNEKQNKSYVVSPETPGAKQAILEYALLTKADHYSLLEIRLLTGRHHQIRAQLAAIGCPVKGDLKYGAKRSNPDGSINLHAWKLSFQHPVTKEMLTFEAPLPLEKSWPDFAKIP